MKKSTLSLSLFGLCFLSTAYIVNSIGEGQNYRFIASQDSSLIRELVSGLKTLKLSVHTEPSQLLEAKEKLETQIEIAKVESENTKKLKSDLELEVSILKEELAIEQSQNDTQSEKANKLALLVDEKILEINGLVITLNNLEEVRVQHDEIKLEFEKLSKENEIIKNQSEEQILCLLKKQESLEAQIKKLLEDKNKVVTVVVKKEKMEDADKTTQAESDDDAETSKVKVRKKKKEDLKNSDYREIYTQYFSRILEQQKIDQQKREESMMLQILQQMQQRSILNDMQGYSAADSIYNPAAHREMGMLNYMSQLRDRSSRISSGYSPAYLDTNLYQGLNSGLSFHDQYVRDLPMYYNSSQSYRPEQFNFNSRGYDFVAPSITNSSLAGVGLQTSSGNLSGDFIQIF